MNRWGRMLLKIRFFQLRGFFFIFFFYSCSTESEKQTVNLYKLTGETQGTTYEIQVYDNKLNFEVNQIDSILNAFDDELSTYQQSSLISRFNQKTFKDTILPNSSRFVKMLILSDSIFKLSNGFFDPSVKPLIDLWGFDHSEPHIPSAGAIDSVLHFVSFEQGIHFEYSQLSNSRIRVVKHHPNFQLDFNAIAQGYSVDLLIEFIKTMGHQHVYVEIGGEMSLSEFKFDNEPWNIAVESPIENNHSDEKSIQKVFAVSDRSVATSGNYRKYFEIDGEKYAHTINPNTGYQNKHSLLSATVFASSCAIADALATYFMLIGLNESKLFIDSHPELNLDVFLIYDDLNTFKTYSSKGL